MDLLPHYLSAFAGACAVAVALGFTAYVVRFARDDE